MVLKKTVLVTMESLGTEDPDGPEETEDLPTVEWKSPLLGLSRTEVRFNDLGSES